MNGRVTFVANYSKTWLFDHVGRNLEHEGIEVSWIAVNSVISRRLECHYGTERVLFLPLSLADVPSRFSPELKLNELVYGDRALRHTAERGLAYLQAICEPIRAFLHRHRPSHIISELTWAHELLIERMTRQMPDLGAQFVRPEVIRIPNGRFAFFAGDDSSRIVEFAQPSVHAEHPARSGITLVRPGEAQETREGKGGGATTKLDKPSYLTINDRIRARENSLMGRLRKLKRFLTRENITPDDPTLIHDHWLRLRLRVQEELNRERYRFVKRESLDQVVDRPFVLMTLHKQPEASIDVLGRYVEDQSANIINIWRTLPSGWQVVVKEHTNAIGDRAPSFYKRLLRLPGIRLVHEQTDSHELLKRCEVVVTVSGTVAFEAALMGIPALTFAPMYFNRLPGCRRITLEQLRGCTDVRELIPSVQGDRREFQSYLLSNSFEGEVLDPVTSPRVLGPENVRRVAKAVARLVRGSKFPSMVSHANTKAAHVERPVHPKSSGISQ